MNTPSKADEIFNDLVKDPDEVLRLFKEGIEDYDGTLGDHIVLRDKDAIYGAVLLIVTKQAVKESEKEAKRLAELEYMGTH